MGKLITSFNDLATTHPEVAKEWHPTLNRKQTPREFTFGSHKKAWWSCTKHQHKWQATIKDRTRKNKNGCPTCSNQKVLVGFNDLATTHPDIAKEWHPTLNGELTPTNIVAGSNKKVWWSCTKHQHEWEAIIYARTRKNKTGCPVCANQKVLVGFNDLATTHPNIAKEWHPTLNGEFTPNNVIAGSEKKMWWSCTKHQHEWEAIIYARTGKNKTGCPVCSNKKILGGFNDLATIFPNIAKEWHPTLNGELIPTDIVAGSNKKVWWSCTKHQHKWQATIYARTGDSKRECSVCSDQKFLANLNTNPLRKTKNFRKETLYQLHHNL